ncbi:MAG: putative HAD superfamily hydrolase, partial [Microgenomates group bacterium GW2011_GWC1_39_7]
PIGFNTGRAINWVSERVINPLRQRILERKKSLKMLSNIFLSGEYGGTWMEFDKKGNGYVYMNQNISIPLQFQEEIRRMIANKYLYAMFYDEDKKTMVSAEMNPGFNLEEFKEVQKEFYEDVKALIAANGLTNQIRVDNTTIATDIEDATAGKRLGTKKFLEWLRKKRIKPELFRVFGDSAADEEMAEELDINGRNAEYWFVGKELGKKERRFRVLTPQKNFSQLTCQALRELDPVA